MQTSTVVLILLICAFVERSSQLSCIPCDEEKSLCPTADSLSCKYGLGKDPCGCCPVCLNGPGEACGGAFDVLGLCGEGLECVAKRTAVNIGGVYLQEGICVLKAP